MKISFSGAFYYLNDVLGLESRLLAQCLGKANTNPSTFSATGRVKGQNYEWDYGDIYNPHLIRLVQRTQDLPTNLCKGYLNSENNNDITCNTTYTYSPGFIVPIYYDINTNLYIIYTRAGADFSPDTFFSVFTTTGMAQLVSEDSRVYTLPETPYSTTVYTINSTNTYPGYIGKRCIILCSMMSTFMQAY